MQQTSASPLTVLSGVGAADGGHGGSPRHYELVRVALVVGGLGLGEDHVVHVEPGMRSLRSAQGGGGSGPGSGFRCSGKLRKGQEKDKGKDE